MRLKRICGFLLSLLSLFGCSKLSPATVPTALPPEFLPTAVVLTLEASGVQLTLPATPAAPPTFLNPVASATQLSLPPDTATSSPPTETSPAPTSSPASATALPLDFTPNPLLFTATFTPLPDIPNARVQIFRLGELSLVTSPLDVSARLTSRVGKVVRVELYGEDGRLLARQVKVYTRIPWTTAILEMKLDFEISAAAEAGRLVISVEDSFGRLIDVNSINLILLSRGITEIKPASALHQAIVIQDPAPKTLIQGGKLYVSGLAKPFYDQPLRVVLLTEDGRTVGQRLAGVEYTQPGFHGKFFAEVSYTVSEITPVLLVVFEDGGVVSDVAHLASIEILLSP